MKSKKEGDSPVSEILENAPEKSLIEAEKELTPAGCAEIAIPTNDLKDDSREKSPRSLVFKASSNSLVFSLTMFFGLLIYGLMVLFIVPTAWLEEKNWQVVSSLNALLYLFIVSVVFFPVSLLFQLMVGGLVQDFKKYTWQMELAGLCIALLMALLFYWPGYWL